MGVIHSKGFSKKQKLVILVLVKALVLGALISCIIAKQMMMAYAFMAVLLLCLACAAILFAKNIQSKNKVYSGELKMVGEKYIQSIQEVVNAAEFEMHVKYLMCVRDEVFDKYEKELMNSPRLKAEGDQEIVRDFLSYVKSIRVNKDEDQLNKDINILRYGSEFKIVAPPPSEKKESYHKLFRVTQALLWKVMIYKPEEVNKEMIDVFHERVQGINENTTLEEALRAVCVLDLEGNADKLLSGLKDLLVVYHPDKNRHEKARGVFDQVYSVYEAVNTILKKYESHFDDTIFCDLKEFYGWKLKDIKESEVHHHIVLMERPFGHRCKTVMKEYQEEKQVIFDIRDNILMQYRRIMEIEGQLLEKAMNYPKLKPTKLGRRRYKGPEKEYVPSTATEEEFKERLWKEHKKQIPEIKKLESEEKEVLKNLSEVENEFTLRMRKLLKMYEPIKAAFKEEIKKESSSVKEEDDSIKYAKKKRVENLQKKLNSFNEEEENIRTFPSKLKYKKGANFIKQEGVWKALWHAPTYMYDAADGARGYMYQDIETKYDYIISYSELYNEYKELRAEIESCDIMLGKNKKHVFYKWQKEVVEVGQDARNYNTTHSATYEIPERNIKQDFAKKAEKLRVKGTRLKGDNKTQQEIEKEYKGSILNIKDFKGKFAEVKQEIEEMEAKIEQAEIREEAAAAAKKEAQAKAEEERAEKEKALAKAEEEQAEKEKERAEKEKALAKAETFQKLLLQVQRGELPVSALSNLDIEALGAAGPAHDDDGPAK